MKVKLSNKSYLYSKNEVKEIIKMNRCKKLDVCLKKIKCSECLDGRFIHRKNLKQRR